MADDMLIGDGLSNFLHPDKSKVSIFVTDGEEGLAGVELTTEALDDIILNLGRLRAQMVPEVPKKLDPNPAFRDVSRGTKFHIDRPHKVSREMFIAVRHPGFGWLAFPMQAENAYLLGTLIMEQVETISPNLVVPNKSIIKPN